MKISSRSLLIRSGALVAILAVTAASAAPVVYNSRALFDAATTGTTTVDFEGEASYTHRGSSFTVSGTTFTADINYLFTLDAGWYGPGFASDYLNMNVYGVHYIDISAAGMTAIGFDFGTLNETFGAQSDVTVLDSLGNSYHLTAPTQPTLGFVGLTSDVTLTSVRVSGELVVLDNVTTGRARAAELPLPGTLALVGLGLAALGVANRRKF